MTVQESGSPSGPTGIGGWLVLLAIGLIFAPLRLFAQAIETRSALEFILPGDPVRTFVILEVVVFSIIGVALIVGAVLFFRRKRIAPLFIGCVFGAAVLFTIFETVVIAINFPEIPAIDPPTVFAIVVPLLWIGYLRASERVKNTFVN